MCHPRGGAGLLDCLVIGRFERILQRIGGPVCIEPCRRKRRGPVDVLETPEEITRRCGIGSVVGLMSVANANMDDWYWRLIHVLEGPGGMPLFEALLGREAAEVALGVRPGFGDTEATKRWPREVELARPDGVGKQGLGFFGGAVAHYYRATKAKDGVTFGGPAGMKGEGEAGWRGKKPWLDRLRKPDD